MPTYDYECRRCAHRIEVIHAMTDAGPSACDRCGGEMRRILFPAGIIFKGSGFYTTDSRAEPSTDSGGSSSQSPKRPTSETTSSGPESSAGPAPPGGDQRPRG